MNFLKSIFRGEKSLPFTYWLCYAIPSALILIYFKAIIAAAFPLSEYQTIYQLLVYSAMGLSVFIVYGLGYAVLRSARNRDPMGFWGWAACIVVIIGMARVPFDFYYSFAVDGFEEFAHENFRFFNSGLPKRIDEITTLKRLSYDAKIVTYHYVIDRVFTGEVDYNVVKGLTINTSCEAWKSDFDSGNLIAVEHRYLIQSRVDSFKIVPEDCF